MPKQELPIGYWIKDKKGNIYVRWKNRKVKVKKRPGESDKDARKRIAAKYKLKKIIVRKVTLKTNKAVKVRKLPAEPEANSKQSNEQKKLKYNRNLDEEIDHAKKRYARQVEETKIINKVPEKTETKLKEAIADYVTKTSKTIPKVKDEIYKKEIKNEGMSLAERKRFIDAITEKLAQRVRSASALDSKKFSQEKELKKQLKDAETKINNFGWAKKHLEKIKDLRKEKVKVKRELEEINEKMGDEDVVEVRPKRDKKKTIRALQDEADKLGISYDEDISRDDLEAKINKYKSRKKIKKEDEDEDEMTGTRKTRKPLETMTLFELRKLATKQGIKNSSTYKKTELIEELLDNKQEGGKKRKKKKPTKEQLEAMQVLEQQRQARLERFQKELQEDPSQRGQGFIENAFKSKSSILRALEQQGKGYAKGKPLSEDEINQAMKKYPHFYGTVARDELNLIRKSVSPSTKKVGFIMNTDKRGKAGQHWVAIYIDHHAAEYFDPFGIKGSNKGEPEEDTREGIRKILDKMGIGEIQLKHNKIQKQSITTNNCGWFSQQFLVDRFKGKPFMDASGFSQVDQSEKEIAKFKKKFPFENV
jgi:hypothetical protein